MPREIKSSDQFQKLIPKAHEIRVVRTPESVKLKIRTSELLYTYKTSSTEADDILKAAKDVPVVELSSIEQKKSEDSSKVSEEPKKATEEKQQPKPKSTKKRK